MSQWSNPTGRTRGGRSEFNWDDIKAAQKKEARVRENYIGQSVMTEDSWIWKGGQRVDEGEDLRREMEEIKRKEAALMAQQLGYKVDVGREKKQLDKHDVQELLQKGQLQFDDKDTMVARGGLGQSNKNSFSLGSQFTMSERLEGTLVAPSSSSSSSSSSSGTYATPVASLAIAHGSSLQQDNETKAKKKKKKKDKKKKDRKKKKKKKKNAESDSSSSDSSPGRKRHRSRSRSPPRRLRHDTPPPRTQHRSRSNSPRGEPRRRHDTPP